eukprot:CAMPEP_0179148456 /NCGR_PEP_ID=MMETSP0796-20121207/71844_1 /TAXON_ID=73915 /ORGANISM="Pyrodinium bahamense, Strain pbaha01" /LENGTH=52 /DNA_ID=CAMNT_0020849177 /DNA_START=98 /DNA_END=253 /DNA_ORIENTATION=-
MAGAHPQQCRRSIRAAIQTAERSSHGRHRYHSNGPPEIDAKLHKIRDYVLGG